MTKGWVLSTSILSDARNEYKFDSKNDGNVMLTLIDEDPVLDVIPFL